MHFLVGHHILQLCHLLSFVDTKLEQVPYGISSGWVDELNKNKLWKEFCKKLPFIKRNEVKEMGEYQVRNLKELRIRKQFC